MEEVVRQELPEDVSLYIETLYEFLRLANGVFLDPDDNEAGQTVDIEGVFGEKLRLMKTDGLYSLYVKDADEERLEELDAILSLDQFFDRIKFPVKRVEYMCGNENAAFKDFEPPESAYPLEFIKIQNDAKFQKEAALLHIGDRDVEVIQECFKQYKLTKFLGRGSYGSVFSACIGTRCDYAIKIILLGGPGAPLGQPPAVFIRESKIIEQLADIDVGPEFFDAWICELPTGLIFGCVVTEMWSGELLRDECLTENQISKLETQIKKIHARGEVHGDIFLKNVLVKRKNGKIVDVTE